jgi:integrase
VTRLDRNAIRKLAVGERITESGITAERAESGVRFSVSVMVDGSRVQRRGLGSLTEAREFIEQARTDARHGRLNLPKGRKLALTFATAADDYLRRLDQSGGKNVPNKRQQLAMHLKPYFGTMRLDGITGFTIEKYKKRRLDQGAAAATVNRELATISHLFNKAVEWRWLDHVPAKAKKLAESAGRIIALSDDECDALMAAAVASADPDLWLFVAFGLHTAMRDAEIMAARWDRLDAVNRRLFIPDAKAVLPATGGAWIGRFAKPSRRLGSIRRRSRRTSCGIRRLPSWYRPASIFRPCNGSAGIRRWRWCCAMRTSTVATSTGLFWRSGERSRNAPRTPLHQNYTSPARHPLGRSWQVAEFSATIGGIMRSFFRGSVDF